jgi:hypothetical protein
VFHLAKKCPHCGAPQSEAPEGEEAAAEPKPKRPPELKLSAEEAKALLAIDDLKQPSSTLTFADVAQELVLWKDGLADRVLTVLAAPLTVVTVLTMGYLLSRRRRVSREDGMGAVKLFAVPLGTAMFAASLFEASAPAEAFYGLGACFGAWGVRTFLRASRRPDPLA